MLAVRHRKSTARVRSVRQLVLGCHFSHARRADPPHTPPPTHTHSNLFRYNMSRSSRRKGFAIGEKLSRYLCELPGNKKEEDYLLTTLDLLQDEQLRPGGNDCKEVALNCAPLITPYTSSLSCLRRRSKSRPCSQISSKG